MTPARVIRRLVLSGLIVLAVGAMLGCSSAADRAQAYYASGTAYVAKGDLVKASLEFRNALRLKGDFVDAELALADVQQQQGDFTNAARGYLAVTEQVPGNLPSRVRLSYLLLAAGQLDQASKYADEAGKIAPDDPTALVARAAVALKRGDRAQAVTLAKAATTKQPGFVDALMVLASERLLASDAPGALAFLDQAPADSDGNVGLQLLRLGVLDAMHNGPAVEQLFTKLIKRFPDTPSFRQGLVQWYLTKGRKDDAEQVMRQYVADNSKDDQAELTLVAFLTTQRNADAAITELERAIEARSKAGGDSFGLQMALGQLQFVSGKQTDAIASVQSIVAKTSDPKQRNAARVELARMMVGQGQTAQAETLASAVIAEDAGNVDALTVRAAIRLQRNDGDEAVQDLLAALNQASDNAGLHGLLAQAYERGGQATLAEQEYAKAMDLSHNAPEAGLAMARFLLRYGKTDQASRTLDTVRAGSPNNRDVLTLLAQLKLAGHDWTGAQQIADALHKLDNGSTTDPTAARIGAAALNGLDKYSDSITLLQSALTTDANRQQVLPDLISSYLQAGKAADAESYLKSLLATDPNNVQAQILLGSVYLKDGKNDLAEAGFKAAAAADSGVDGSVALVQFYLSTSNLNAARDTAEATLKRDGSSNALRLMLAGIYEQLDLFDNAITEYDTLFKQDPTSILVANDLASLLSERRTDQPSLDRAFDIAQRLAGADVPQYADTAGWIYYRRGDYASALPLLKSAAEKLPGVAMVQYHLGMTLWQLGQADPAKSALQQAVALSPPLFSDDMDAARQTLDKLAKGILPPPSSGSTS